MVLLTGEREQRAVREDRQDHVLTWDIEEGEFWEVILLIFDI